MSKNELDYHTNNFGRVINHSLDVVFYLYRDSESGNFFTDSRELKLSHQTYVKHFEDKIESGEISQIDFVEFDESRVEVLFEDFNRSDLKEKTGDIKSEISGNVAYLHLPNRFGWSFVNEDITENPIWDGFHNIDNNFQLGRKVALYDVPPESNWKRETIWADF